MSRDADGCLVVVGLGAAGLGALWLTKAFGVWPWIIMGIAGYLWFKSNEEKAKAEEEKRRLERERAPCKHGTAGGHLDPAKCYFCVAEQRAEQERRSRQAAMEAEQCRQREIECLNPWPLKPKPLL